MYPTSDRYKDVITNLVRDLTIRLEVRPVSQSSITFTDSDIVQNSVSVEESVMASNVLDIGGTVASSLSFSILLNDTNSVIDYTNAEVEAYVTLILPATTEYPVESSEEIPLGIFIIDDINRKRKTIDFTALDHMTLLDVDYSESTLEYPATLSAIYSDACSVTGVSEKTGQASSLYNYTVPRRPDSGNTFRNVISSIAQIQGGYARIDRNGDLSIEWLETTTPSTHITPMVRSDLSLNDAIRPVTGVTMTTNSGTYTDVSSTKGNVVDISDNLLIQDNHQDVMDHFSTYDLYSTSVRPHVTKWGGDPALEAGDLITVTTVDDETFTTNITKTIFKYHGTCEASCVSELSGSFKVIPSGSNNTDNTKSAIDALTNYLGVNYTADGSGWWVHDGLTIDTSTVVYGSDGSISNPNEAEWYNAVDTDFSGTKNGDFVYIGTHPKVIIPTVIKTKTVTSYSGMFHEHLGYEVIRGAKYGGTQILDVSSMFFRSNDSYSDHDVLDISELDVSRAMSMADMFRGRKVTELLTGSGFTTEYCTNMSGMFRDSLGIIHNVPLSNFNTTNVTNMSYMFYGVDDDMAGIDLSSFDTSNVINMSNMFNGADLSINSDIVFGFNTSKVKNMAGMFQGCTIIGVDFSTFNTENVAYMNSMFANAVMTNVDLSSFNTYSVSTMSSMFQYAYALNVDISNFDTSNVTDMTYMFREATINGVDLTGFDTSKVTTMYGMFYNTIVDTLNLSSFDMSGVTTTTKMLTGCTATTGIARTQADADILNAIDGKPATLTFYPI